MTQATDIHFICDVFFKTSHLPFHFFLFRQINFPLPLIHYVMSWIPSDATVEHTSENKVTKELTTTVKPVFSGHLWDINIRLLQDVRSKQVLICCANIVNFDLFWTQSEINAQSVTTSIWNNHLISFKTTSPNNVKRVSARPLEVKSPWNVPLLQVLCDKMA